MRYAHGRFPFASRACGPNRKRFTSFVADVPVAVADIDDSRVDQGLVQLDTKNGIRQRDLADFLLLNCELYGRIILTRL